MRSLNLGSAISSARIGVCALQIGHHEAWMATKIGLPAFCASAKAASLKGCGPAADAGATAAALAATAAKRTERRDSMRNSSLVPWVDGAEYMRVTRDHIHKAG